MIDLTERLPAEVHAFNAANPASPIRLLGKCEFSNPGMSHKDRIAKVMLQRAAARGDLTAPDGSKKVILAASSGNTGCSLALVGSLMGYEVVIITNKLCSEEKKTHIQSNGATLWLAESLPRLFPDELMGELDYIKQEKLLVESFPDKYFSVNQYGNGDNPDAHSTGTGPEIWDQTQGSITHFVMAASTGGTIMGVGAFLKDRNPAVQVVLADPDKSRLHGLLAQCTDPAKGQAQLDAVEAKIRQTGGMKVEGAGKAILTDIMTKGANGAYAVLPVVDMTVVVKDFDAFDECRATASKGVLVGGSAGLNICAAQHVALQCALHEAPREGGVTIVTLLCDHGIKYMSKIFNDEWIAENREGGRERSKQ